MNINSYREFLLSNIPTASLASGGSVISCRCFYCPDSRDPRHKHFYISIPKDNETPSLYYCHKCHTKGVVTHNTLLEWNIFESDIAENLIEHNKKCSVKKSNATYFVTNYNLSNRLTSDNEVSRLKLDYINTRLGTKFTYQDLRDLKIVLNLYDLLNDNHITDLTRNPNIVDQLNGNFIGFISIDNAFLNMRRVCDEGLVYKGIDKRYVNYKVFDKFDNSHRFYTIPTSVNLMSRNRIKIHVAEGPFDILSIYENLRKREPGVYTSIAGSNYIGMIGMMLDLLRTPYVEFHYYPDNDKLGSNNNMRYVKGVLDSMKIPLIIHRNLKEGEKDFGVSLDKIQESVFTI